MGSNQAPRTLAHRLPWTAFPSSQIRRGVSVDSLGWEEAVDLEEVVEAEVLVGEEVRPTVPESDTFRTKTVGKSTPTLPGNSFRGRGRPPSLQCHSGLLLLEGCPTSSSAFAAGNRGR